MKIEINLNGKGIKNIPKSLVAGLRSLWATINASKENKVLAAGVFLGLLNIFNFMVGNDMFTVPFLQ